MKLYKSRWMRVDFYGICCIFCISIAKSFSFLDISLNLTGKLGDTLKNPQKYCCKVQSTTWSILWYFQLNFCFELTIQCTQILLSSSKKISHFLYRSTEHIFKLLMSMFQKIYLFVGRNLYKFVQLSYATNPSYRWAGMPNQLIFVLVTLP